MRKKNIFTEPRSKWTEGVGPEQNVVISSRIRLARNIDSVLFPNCSTPRQQTELIEEVKKVLSNKKPGYQSFSMMETELLDRMVLMEKHLTSPMMAFSKNNSAVSVRNDEAVAIMVNEEDHIRIQCLYPALQLEELWHMANQVDDMIAKNMRYAFSERWGYLTACPTNTGTGLRASVMLHLPGLIIQKAEEQLFRKLPAMGLAVRGIYGEGSKSQGHLYQISNQITLGRSETEIISALKHVVLQIVGEEKKARKIIAEKHSKKIYDRIMRAYGLMLYAHSVSSEEAMDFISMLRLGVDLGIVPLISNSLLNEIMLMIQPHMLSKITGREMNAEERDWERAALIRSRLKAQDDLSQ